MEQVTVENFRCFREKQTARLAPLTLLVGDNSTGKTSFLALVRALWEVGYGRRSPDFKEDPYDLGSFDELANRQTIKDSRSKTIRTGFVSDLSRFSRHQGGKKKPLEIEIHLSRKGVMPIVSWRYCRDETTWVKEFYQGGDFSRASAGTINGSWQWKKSLSHGASVNFHGFGRVPFDLFIPSRPFLRNSESNKTDFRPLNGSPSITEEDWNLIFGLLTSPLVVYPPDGFKSGRPFASAPLRSRPRRTYDPSRPTPDPQGDYVPMYLANTYFQDDKAWKYIKNRLESFGQSSGLFDEISIKQLGTRGSEPFQVQIRKFSHRVKGLQRNLIDVGYGVSQILPVIVEILLEGSAPMFLLQQPEVHLHPSAQAALGSFFCETASWGRQIIVETHSDYLLNRIRMDVCEGKGQLKPEDVSILFFDRAGLDVQIHSIRIDNNGNIIDQPPGYRQFFNDEMRRSLRV